MTNSQYYWIGATDKRTENSWEWVTGEAFIYSNWYPGEPNNSLGIEHYAYIQGDGTWNDRSVTSGNIDKNIIEGFILEKDNVSQNPGDADGDGKCNLADVSIVLKHIAKWSVDIDVDAADVNGDGTVNIQDVSLMLKWIAGWDVEMK